MSKRKRRALIFPLLVRTIGVKQWQCPCCGYFNETRVSHLSWQVRCTYRACRARFAHGEVFWRLPNGNNKLRPFDTVIPVGFPDPELPLQSAPIGGIYDRQRVNRLVDLCEDTSAENTLEYEPSPRMVKVKD